MPRFLSAAVCTFFLSACASTPPKPEPVPPELVPVGFSAADCRVTEPGGPLTETGLDGRPMQVGTRPPKVQCSQHVSIASETTTCHTKGGKPLPMSDCCLNLDGSKVPECTPKPQSAGE